METIDIINYTPYTGYKIISINRKTYKLHRLVANKEFVNHKDGNKLNNSLDNLEWATCPENNIHAIENGLSNSTKK